MHRIPKALHAKFIEVLNSVLWKLSAVVGRHVFDRENEISCHPRARWLRVYRSRSLACLVRPCVRTRLTSEQTRRLLVRNRRDPSRLLRARRVALVASRFG